MKQNVLFFLFLLSALCMHSQEVRHPDLSGMPGYVEPRKISGDMPQLDSIVIYSMTTPDSMCLSKYRYQYDRSGYLTLAENNTRHFITNISEFTEWEASTVFKYTFAGDNIVQSVIKVTDEDYLMKTDYQYSSENRKTKEVYYWSYDLTSWDQIAELNIEYDSDNRLLTESEMENENYGLITEYNYYLSGLISQKTVSESISGHKSTERKTEYIYDADNRLQTMKFYAIMGNPSLFLNYEEIYTYENDRVSSILAKSYNYDGSMWNHTLESFSYDSDGRIVSKLLSSREGDAWINSSCDSFAYNSQGVLIHEASYLWMDNEWRGQFRSDYKTDDQNNITAHYRYDYNDGWVLNKTMYYFYSANQITSVRPLNFADFECYPNPVDGPLYINTGASAGQMTLYSVDGKMVHQQLLSGGTNQVKYSFSNPGIYLVKVQTNDSEQIQKIIVR